MEWSVGVVKDVPTLMKNIVNVLTLFCLAQEYLGVYIPSFVKDKIVGYIVQSQ